MGSKGESLLVMLYMIRNLSKEPLKDGALAPVKQALF